jgi:hypothetical protein
LAFAIASLPLRLSYPPISSSRRSVSVSTRETKKLATDATLPASPPGPLEPADVGLGHLGIALEREDEGHVGRLASGDHLLDRGHTGLGRRDLDVEVGPVDQLV